MNSDRLFRWTFSAANHLQSNQGNHQSQIKTQANCK